MENRIDRAGLAVLGIILALGLIVGGYLLGSQIKATRLSDRYVTVRGLVERTVKSDLAIWPLTYKEAGDDLPSLYAKTQTDKQIILDFLKARGIRTNEIDPGIVRVVDTQANEFGGNQRAAHRYIVDQEIIIRTQRVDVVATAAQDTIQLVQAGIVLGSNGRQGPTYRFMGLNAIKPDMITEATRNARAAAIRFASDSGSKVGAIRGANQGVFSINSTEAVGGAEEGAEGGAAADSSVMKTVRVVTSVEYYLEN